MKKVVFIFLLALGSAWNCHAQSWSFVQQSISPTCIAPASSCHIAPLDSLPTVAGSGWIIMINTQTNITITSVCTWLNCNGTSAGWTPCPSCHIYSSAVGHNLDAWYNVSNTPAGSTDFTVTFSGSSGSILDVELIEFLPPPGSTAVFDTAGTSAATPCSGSTCTGVALTLSGTDFVYQSMHGANPTGWNAWSSPYITDYSGDGIGLNITSGAAPTVTIGGTQAMFMALAFKSTAGSFTPPAKQYSVVNFANSGVNGLACNPSCTLSIPATGSGHLLYLESGADNGGYISSVSGGGTWMVPSACQVNLVGSGNDAGHNFKLSCAYVLSSTSGVTSLNIAGGGNMYFAAWEIASTSGTFQLDGNPLTATRSPTYVIQGITLPTTGANDVAFQSVFCPGGVSSVTFYPQPRVGLPGAGGQFFPAQAADGVLLNTGPTVPTAVWPSANNKSTSVAGIAFKTSGGPTPPAPPTVLKAVVH